MNYQTTSYELSDAAMLEHLPHLDIGQPDSEMTSELEDYDSQYSGEYYAKDVLDFLKNNSV
ncbi:MAG: hypothetical protein V4443_07970 [Pseudomonadota bacterium]